MPYRDDDRRRAAQREWARRKRSGSTPGGSTRPRLVEPERDGGHLLDSAGGALALLGEQAAIVRATHADPLVRARTIAQLVAQALKAVEASHHEDRIASIEARLADRQETA